VRLVGASFRYRYEWIEESSMPVFPVLTVLPLSATIIAGAFAIVLLNRYLASRRRPHELMWGIAFTLFAIGAACQVFADVAGGWNEAVARTYYLTGAILNVGFLGLGTVYLLFKRSVANVALAVMLLLAVAGIVVVFTVPVDAATLGEQAGWKAVTKFSSAPRYLAILSNTLGTILVVGGALWSGFIFWRKGIMKSRMVGVFLLAAGTMIVASGGTILGATGLTNPDHNYLSMVVGVSVMFAGYLQSIKPAPLPRASELAPVPTSPAGHAQGS
jgi:hypothetical protein